MAQDVVPPGAALGCGYLHAAGEGEEVRRLGDDRAGLLDTEQELVTRVKIQRLPHASGDRHMALRRDLRSNVHTRSLLADERKDTGRQRRDPLSA